MRNFGLKAFLRAIALFVSVLLVKMGIDKIIQIPEPLTKVLYVILIIVVILVVLLVPSYMPSRKPKNSEEERKNEI